MRIGIIDTIKVLKGSHIKGTLEEIAIKYKCTVPELECAARERAVKVLKTAIPLMPDKRVAEDGRVHFICPDCETDISDWGSEWSFCPYCGQAVSMLEEKAE